MKYIDFIDDAVGNMNLLVDDINLIFKSERKIVENHFNVEKLFEDILANFNLVKGESFDESGEVFTDQKLFRVILTRISNYFRKINEEAENQCFWTIRNEQLYIVFLNYALDLNIEEILSFDYQKSLELQISEDIDLTVIKKSANLSGIDMYLEKTSNTKCMIALRMKRRIDG
jgi:hypothetical protein